MHEHSCRHAHKDGHAMSADACTDMCIHMALGMRGGMFIDVG